MEVLFRRVKRQTDRQIKIVLDNQMEADYSEFKIRSINKERVNFNSYLTRN